MSSVADLGYYCHLTRAQRAAVLRFLATTDGLRFDGPVTDWAGRPGVAISITDPTTRYELTIDPHTGRLLAFEETITRNPGSLRVPIPALHEYVLHLQSGRRNQPGQIEPTL